MTQQIRAQAYDVPGAGRAIRPVRRHRSRALGGASHLAYQVAVAVIATGLASALFGVGRNSAPDTTASGKLTTRVAVADIAPPGYFAAPEAAPPAPAIENAHPPVVAQPDLAKTPKIARPRMVRRDDATKPVRAFVADTNVLPPRRPLFAAAATPAAPAPVVPASDGDDARPAMKIAGLSIPGVDFARYLPDGEPLSRTVAHARSALDWVMHVGMH